MVELLGLLKKVDIVIMIQPPPLAVILFLPFLGTNVSYNIISDSYSIVQYSNKLSAGKLDGAAIYGSGSESSLYTVESIGRTTGCRKTVIMIKEMAPRESDLSVKVRLKFTYRMQCSKATSIL